MNTLIDFLLLSAKGAILGAAILAPLIAALMLIIRRSEHKESQRKSAQMQAWLRWYSSKPDPQTYYDDDDGQTWDRKYYHDLAQYARKHGSQPTLK